MTAITSPLALAYTAIQNAALRFWFATPSRWCRATFRTGAEYTLEVAGNLPDSEVFSRSKFSNAVLRRLFGFGRDALVRKAGGMATSMYSTSRHPLRRLNNGALGSESQVGAKTMCPSPMASRRAAPASPTFDPIATHFEAVNACAMARWYAARYEHTKAARKATQALSALRKLQAFEATSASPCTNCPENRPLPSGPLDFFDTPVVGFAIERRTACTLCPAADKPCLKNGGAA